MRSMVMGMSAMLCGPEQTVKKARRLRRAMSVPEVLLWNRLRSRQGRYKFRRRHPAGTYLLDFFCSDTLLALKVDGISLDMGDRPVADETRDRARRKRRVEVLRTSAADVSRSADQVIEWIVAACDRRCNPLHHSPAASGPPPRSGEETKECSC